MNALPLAGSRLILEQMYLKIASKIFVFEPNSWETLTDFPRDKSRTGLTFINFSQRLHGDGSNMFKERACEEIAA